MKNLLGVFICLFFVTSLGYSQQSQVKKPDKPIQRTQDVGGGQSSAMFVDCNINAGGDISYCFDTDTIKLFGSESGINSSSVSWTNISSPVAATSVTINSPSSLVTSFTTVPSTYPAGDYTFVISGTCTSDGTPKTDTVVITVTPPASPSQILDLSGTALGDTFVVCTHLEILGNTPGAGETGYWSSTAGVGFSQDGDTLRSSVSASSNCIYRTFYYTISNGGCISTDTIVVKFERGTQNPFIYYGDRNLCGDTIRVIGSNFGCNGSGSWTIIPPSGTAIPASQTYQNGRYIDIYFTVGGAYQIIYNVTSTGVCPGGSDTVNYNVCISGANGIGSNINRYVCDTYPDTVFLTSIVDASYTYSPWTLYGGVTGTPPVTIVQTGVGQGYALIYDQTPNFYRFRIVATGATCSFPDGSVANCNASKIVTIRRAESFTSDSDTLNIFCQNPGEFFRPTDYITTSGAGGYAVLTSVSVPSGCTNIIAGNTYSEYSYLDFSCEGTYVFRNVISTSIGGGLYCRDTMEWVVNVATLQQPSAGSDSYIRICDNDTVPLVGSAALDINGNVNPFAISTWTQVDGLPPVTFLGSVNSQTVNVTGFLTPGTYMFEYSFSRDSNCYLADTMIIVVDSCEPCPEFKLQTCCDLMNGGAKSAYQLDPAIKRIIDQYQQAMKSKYRSSSIDCCSPCNNPTDSFPVFITDTANFLINPSLYNITWSHDASNNNNVAYIYPNQQVIVTVSGPDSCVWSDTFLLECCLDTVKIEAFCAWDPCTQQNVPVPLRVVDLNGNPITSGYTVLWSNGFTTYSTSALISMMPISVIVTDTATGCVYYDTFDIDCTPPCVPTIPTNLACNYTHGTQVLTWNNIPGVTYELEMNYNDPRCCKTGIPPTGIRYVLTTNSYSGPYAHKCFSWRVRSICPDGTKSAWSVYECSCAPPPCVAKVPTNLRCTVAKGGQSLTWNAVPGATYEVAISWNDPKCCRNGQIGFSQLIQTTNPSHYISGLTGCFSWRVRSVCPDGTRSAWSTTACSCAPVISICKPVVPTGLRCTVTRAGQLLSWTAIPGRTYEITLYYGDPKCCRNQLGYITIPTPVSTNSFLVTSNKCFSWKVRSVCADGTKSAWSTTSCSCSSIIVIDPKGGVKTEIGIKSNGGTVNKQEMKVTTAPNPARDFVTFNVNTKETAQELGSLQVTTLTGELVYSSQIKLNGQTMVDLTSLNAGTYIYKVISDGTFKSGRIVITD